MGRKTQQPQPADEGPRHEVPTEDLKKPWKAGHRSRSIKTLLDASVSLSKDLLKAVVNDLSPAIVKYMIPSVGTTIAGVAGLLVL